MTSTEFPFTLPLGYVDAEGNTHRDGIMRLSTAYDEIAPLRDPRVQANPGYLVLILLSRVITRLGSLEQLNPKLIEGLYSADLIYLQDFYQRINQNGHSRLHVACPHCSGEFEVEPIPVGESPATPQTDYARR
ncbi:phage tail assembly protein [Leptolyngbya sp. DQ-M1]|uniref:phage tail assembly protein n=1 Tax=Leptolyngbya sp. DQ-M1 TaxID=2933920 RepID=UPI00329714BF